MYADYKKIERLSELMGLTSKEKKCFIDAIEYFDFEYDYNPYTGYTRDVLVYELADRMPYEKAAGIIEELFLAKTLQTNVLNDKKNILVVGDGKYFRLAHMLASKNVKVTVYDVNLDDKEIEKARELGLNIVCHKEMFVAKEHISKDENYDFVIGNMPCHGAYEIIEYASSKKIDYRINLCYCAIVNDGEKKMQKLDENISITEVVHSLEEDLNIQNLPYDLRKTLFVIAENKKHNQ